MTCSLYCNQEAEYFAELQMHTDDTDYIAETGKAVYDWWGLCCAECLRRLQETPELIWLEAIPLSDVPVTIKESHYVYYPDWDKATVRVGSRPAEWP